MAVSHLAWLYYAHMQKKLSLVAVTWLIVGLVINFSFCTFWCVLMSVHIFLLYTLLSKDLVQMLACVSILARIDWCNAAFHALWPAVSDVVVSTEQQRWNCSIFTKVFLCQMILKKHHWLLVEWWISNNLVSSKHECQCTSVDIEWIMLMHEAYILTWLVAGSAILRNFFWSMRSVLLQKPCGNRYSLTVFQSRIKTPLYDQVFSWRCHFCHIVWSEDIMSICMYISLLLLHVVSIVLCLWLIETRE